MLWSTSSVPDYGLKGVHESPELIEFLFVLNSACFILAASQNVAFIRPLWRSPGVAPGVFSSKERSSLNMWRGELVSTLFPPLRLREEVEDPV